MKKYFFIVAILLSSFTVFSQDIIKLKNKTEISGKVIEIGIDEIKYKAENNQDGPVIVLAKTEITEIIFQNGSTYKVAPDPYDVSKEVEVRNCKHVIKFDFMSPVYNHLTFGYESVIKVGMNVEFKAGIIGPGFRKDWDPASGAFIKAGMKFLKTPDYLQRGTKLVHALKGSYIKPELIFSSYSKTMEVRSTSYSNSFFGNTYTFSREKVSFNDFAFNICFGRQTILGNIMTFDYFVGIGMGTNSVSKSIGYSDDGHYAYSHVVSSNVVFSAGMTLGVLY